MSEATKDRLREAAPDMLAALMHIRKTLSEATLANRRLTKDELFALLSWAVVASAKATGEKW